jgi:hypothetical protein
MYMPVRMTREECLLLLCTRAEEIGRRPNKADFSEHEVARIKAYFGPWPRALEAAGLKPPKTEERIRKNREKRIRAKRRRNEALKGQSN